MRVFNLEFEILDKSRVVSAGALLEECEWRERATDCERGSAVSGSAHQRTSDHMIKSVPL